MACPRDAAEGARDDFFFWKLRPRRGEASRAARCAQGRLGARPLGLRDENVSATENGRSQDQGFRNLFTVGMKIRKTAVTTPIHTAAQPSSEVLCKPMVLPPHKSVLTLI